MKATRLPSLFGAALFAAALLAGCSSLLGVQRQPFTTYAPRYHAPEPAAGGPRVDWQLVVETPQASDTLSTARIVVMPSPGVIEVYPGARWSDPAPTLAQFQSYVAAHEVNYYIVSDSKGHWGADSHSDIADWVSVNFTPMKVGADTVYNLAQPVKK